MMILQENNHKFWKLGQQITSMCFHWSRVSVFSIFLNSYDIKYNRILLEWNQHMPEYML